MKRIVSAAALVLLATPAMAEYAFEGSWAHACETAEGDSIPTVFESGRIVYYESECAIGDVTAIGSADQAWRLKVSCAGEGETWDRTILLALDGDDEGNRRQLIEVDLDDGHVVAREPCG